MVSKERQRSTVMEPSEPDLPYRAVLSVLDSTLGYSMHIKYSTVTTEVLIHSIYLVYTVHLPTHNMGGK